MVDSGSESESVSVMSSASETKLGKMDNSSEDSSRLFEASKKVGCR